MHKQQQHPNINSPFKQIFLVNTYTNTITIIIGTVAHTLWSSPKIKRCSLCATCKIFHLHGNVFIVPQVASVFFLSLTYTERVGCVF